MSTVPQMPAVEIGGLVKRYGQTTAVDGLTLSAALGTVTGFRPRTRTVPWSGFR